MRRTMAGLTASTIPPATAWRARSALVQCVICSPSARGSRQASSTIWARWRGGNLLRAPHAGVVQQELLQPALLVAPADAPDGGAIALLPGCDIVDTPSGGDGQDDAGMLHLEPPQAATAGNGLQNRGVRRRDGQRARPSATHEGASQKGRSSAYSLTRICCRTS